MTEPELVEVLSNRFGLTWVRMEHVSRPEFPRRLFGEHLGVENGHQFLLTVFNQMIIGNKTLCEAEKAIIREVRNMKAPHESWRRVANYFMDSELRSSLWGDWRRG